MNLTNEIPLFLINVFFILCMNFLMKPETFEMQEPVSGSRIAAVSR